MDLNSLIAPVTALVGVFVGAWLVALNDKRKWDREQQVRFDKDRLEAYAAFLAAAEEFFQKLVRNWHIEPKEEVWTVQEPANACFLALKRVQISYRAEDRRRPGQQEGTL